MDCKQVLILPHIAFEGLDHEDACVKDANFIKLGPFNTGNNDQKLLLEEFEKPVINMDAIADLISNKTDILGSTDIQNCFTLKNQTGGNVRGNWKFTPNPNFAMRRIYRGFSTSDTEGKTVVTTNTGHLGAVDSVEHCNRVWGTAGGQIYKRRPTGN